MCLMTLIMFLKIDPLDFSQMNVAHEIVFSNYPHNKSLKRVTFSVTNL